MTSGLLPTLAHAQFDGQTDSPSFSAPPPSGILTHLNGSDISTGQKYLLGASVLGTYYLISQTRNGPLIFGGLYAMGTLVLMRESSYQNAEEASELLVPFSMITMSVINIALFNNSIDRFSYNDVFAYNVIATGLIASYAWWDHSRRLPSGRIRSKSQLLPFIKNDQAGLAWSFNY